MILPFSSLSGLEHTFISKGRQHTDRFRKPANTTSVLCKILLSALALADTEDASSYQLGTPFTSTLSLRYSCSLRITGETTVFSCQSARYSCFLLR